MVVLILERKKRERERKEYKLSRYNKIITNNNKSCSKITSKYGYFSFNYNQLMAYMMAIYSN